MPEKSAQHLSELVPRIMGAFHDLGSHHPEGEHLTMRQYQALIILSADKTLSLSDFSKKLNLASSTGTELANRMIALDYFSKSSDPDDSRKQFLTVTTKGEAVLQKRQKILTKVFTDFLTPFPPQDRNKFIECFEQIHELIEKYHRKKPS